MIGFCFSFLARRTLHGAIALSMLAVSGCGGGGGSTPPTSAPASTFLATAIISVNVNAGTVTVASASKDRAVFAGTAIGINTSVLLNQAGSPGVKVTSVSLTNNTTTAIGADPNGTAKGLRVLFGAFAVTGGSSTDPVLLLNPTGDSASGATGGANLPYIVYPVQIAAGKVSAAQSWNFSVPSGVTAFTFPVTVQADTSYLAQAQSASGAGSASSMVRTLAGSSGFGFQNGTGAQARFSAVFGVAVDVAGNVYCADYYSNTVRRISPNGLVSTVAGSPYRTGFANGNGGVASFRSPSGIAVTPDGSTLYVSDYGNDAIRRIAFTGGDPTNPGNWTVATIVGTGTAGGNYASAQTGDTATLYAPTGLALDAGGDVFLTEQSGNRVRELVFNGGDPNVAKNWESILIAGDVSAVNGVAGDTDGHGGSAHFYVPNGVAVDAAGNVFVADSYNHRIRMITPDLNVTTVAGGVSGDSPSEGYVDGAAATARFSGPFGVALDASGTVYVADTGNRKLRAISRSGNVTTIAGSSNGQSDGLGNVAGFANLNSLIVGASGTVYVGDQTEIRTVEKIISQ